MAATSARKGTTAAMVNFIVPNPDAMLAQLREAGVEVDEKVEDLEGVGRFGWGGRPRGQPLRALGAGNDGGPVATPGGDSGRLQESRAG